MGHSLIDAIVLVGGFGTRLNSISKGMPKSLMPVGNRVFLDYVVDWLSKYNVRRIILCVYYRSEMFVEYVESRKSTIMLSYVIESSPLGTGGAIGNVLRQYEDLTSPFLILNGDTYLDLNLDKMVAHFHQIRANYMLAIRRVKDSCRFGKINFRNKIVIDFQEKETSGGGWISVGCYLMKKKIFNDFYGCYSFEKDVLCKLVSDLNLYVYPVRGNFVDIGIPEDYSYFLTKIKTKGFNLS